MVLRFTDAVRASEECVSEIQGIWLTGWTLSEQSIGKCSNTALAMLTQAWHAKTYLFDVHSEYLTAPNTSYSHE